jgi:hypothetical protein
MGTGRPQKIFYSKVAVISLPQIRGVTSSDLTWEPSYPISAKSTKA